MINKEIKDRYESILDRSFERDLAIFFFNEFLKGTNDEDNLLAKYTSFEPDNALTEKYDRACQLSKYSDQVDGKTVREIDKALDDFFENPSLNQLKDIFRKRFFSIEDFATIYQTNKKECHYCKITEEEIKDLIEKKKINTVRLSMRGRTLEIDRKDAHGNYDKDNIVFCCYWCNNAKTDEFTHDEFLDIGEAIKEIWERRKENL